MGLPFEISGGRTAQIGTAPAYCDTGIVNEDILEGGTETTVTNWDIPTRHRVTMVTISIAPYTIAVGGDISNGFFRVFLNERQIASYALPNNVAGWNSNILDAISINQIIEPNWASLRVEVGSAAGGAPSYNILYRVVGVALPA